jgi:hypothetical protein
LASRPPLPEEGPITIEPTPDDSGAPEAGDNLDRDEDEGSLKGSDSTLSPPLTDSEAQGAEKMWKHTEDLTSSGTSNPKDDRRRFPRILTLVSSGYLTRKYMRSFSPSFPSFDPLLLFDIK